MRAILVAVALTVVTVTTARAHTVGMSKGEYRIQGAGVSASLVFARQELIDAVTILDANRDGAISVSELAAARAGIDATIARQLEIRNPSGPCMAALGDLALTEQDGIVIQLAFRCLGDASPISVRAAFVGALSEGHRHLATVEGGGTTRRDVLHRGHSSSDVTGGPASSVNQVAVLPLFQLGVEHILTGYDHLVFLLGLILIGGRLRSLLVVITAFTVAHSITLGVAALRIWTPNVGIIEPAIALSIAYIGIENWFVTDGTRRWLITFPFGLVHGFGFAGALADISLPAAQVPVALAAFNAGVETGQLAVLAVVLPALAWLRQRQWLAKRELKIVSGAIAVAGMSWFVVRVI